MIECVVSGRPLNHLPSDTELQTAIDAVLSGREEFIILENQRLGVTLQLALSQEPLLEYIEDPPGIPIRAVTYPLDPTTIKRIFIYLLHDDPRWRQVVTWNEKPDVTLLRLGQPPLQWGTLVAITLLLVLIVLALSLR